MTIDVVEEGQQNRGSADLAAHGSFEWSTGATIRDSDGHLRFPAILIRWHGAPRTARMSQSLALRGFGRDRFGQDRAIFPQPPATDIVTSGGVRFPLSAAMGPLHWSVDAIHDPRRRDPGRAYVTDESYSFSERVGGTITFYDPPSLWFEDPSQIWRLQRVGTAIADS